MQDIPESDASKCIDLTLPERAPPPRFSSLPLCWLVLILAVATLGALPTQAQVNILTYHNDNSRDGQNLSEQKLAPANVNPLIFGKLWCKPLDGSVWGQPLVLSNVSLQGGTHTVVLAGTSNDSVYALDSNSGSVYWHVSLIPGGGRAAIRADFRYGGSMDQTGIVSTPVIDAASQTLYAVAETCDGYTGTSACGSSNGHLNLRLHALDVTTGAEKVGGPVIITASTPGSGNGSVGGRIALNSGNLTYLYQRTALLLTGTHVVFGLSAAGVDGLSTDPWFGWLLSYNAMTLAQEAVFAPDSNSYGGGIWMSGAGAAADSNGYIYLATGNGAYDGVASFGDTILKMPPPPSSGAWSPTDWFTPSDQVWLAGEDGDLGSGGVMLVNSGNTGLLVAAGKQGTIYVVNTQNMGKYCGSNCSDRIVQEIPGVNANNQSGNNTCNAGSTNAGGANLTGLWGLPAYWNSSVYFGSNQPDCPAWPNQNDHMKAYSFNGSLSTPMSTAPTSFTAQPLTALPSLWSTPISSVSANGSSNAIVWTVDQKDPVTGNSTLHAYDATNLANELFNSNTNGARDQLDSTPAHVVPTVANGTVFVGTNDCLAAYGTRIDLMPFIGPVLMQ